MVILRMPLSFSVLMFSIVYVAFLPKFIPLRSSGIIGTTAPSQSPRCSGEFAGSCFAAADQKRNRER
jgi:hypothetical protein